MSFDTLAWARRARTGSPAKKALLLVLAEHADEDHSCWPSQALLAEATEQSVRTVRRQLAELEADGLVVREARRRADGGRSTDRFYLQLDAGTPPVNLTGPPGHSPDQGPPVTVLAGAPGHSSGRAEQPVEPPTEQPAEQRAQLALVAERLPEVGATDAFAAFWQAYPRKTDKGAARRAWVAAIRKADAEQIIDGARRYAADPNRDERYTKHAATWLNAEAWDNPPLPPRQAGGARPIPAPSERRDLPQGRIQL